MIWNNIEETPAPKDRVILVSNGWTWRRKDHEVAEVRAKSGRVMREAETVHSREIVGGATLVFWETNTDFPDGGVFAICGGKGMAPRFKFWADIENPITQEDSDRHNVGQVVSNMIPVASEMPVYVETAAERKNKEFREMIGL